MTVNEDKMATKFFDELGVIASNFIKAFGLKYTQEVAHLNDPLLRWMDFRLRYIDPKPRRILFSKSLPKELPSNVEAALKKMTRHFQSGADINPYQGVGLTLHHDTSGKRKQLRTDLLWAEWGITHLHLSENHSLSQDQYFSDRADWLLFALVLDEEVGLIDVRPHGEVDVFSNQELIEIVAESWPQWIERYCLKGILPSRKKFTSNELHQIRKSGLTSPITIGDKVYMGPGVGVTSAATSLKVGMQSDRVLDYVEELARMVMDSKEQFQKFVASSGVDNPSFQLCITPRGMAIYEEKLDQAWVLPRKSINGEKNFLTALHELVAPEWAVCRLLKD